MPEWLNSFVTVKKPNGNLRVCLDPTNQNTSIIRPVCNMRNLEEIIDLLKGSVYFAVFDSTKSFFHIPIDDDSKQLTAMFTPIGIYLYNIAMGLSNATDIFETCMRNIVDGLQGVVNIADDVLVFASDYDTFKSNVVSLLDPCMEHDLHLNLDQIRIDVDSVPFFGQTLTKQGLMMDENKWRVIQDWPIPTNIKELQSFLGSVNYLSKFIPYLSTCRKPLQDLLKQCAVNTEFLWLDNHTDAFNKLKTAMCRDVTLKYYDSSLPIYIECDASKKGIGVVMLQPDSTIENTSKSDVPNNLRPLFYASKTLTETESNYSNIEREMLGVMFSILHFKHFTFGHKVHVVTDHKPLITLFRKNLHATSPRLSHMLVQILDYNIEIHHQEGTKMHLNDALSRLNTHDNATEKSKAKPVADFSVTIHDVEILTGFKSLSLDQVRQETECYTDIQLLKQHIFNGFPKSRSCLPEPIQPYFDYRECSSVVHGVIMKGSHIVIPASLRARTLDTLHSSHMGETKTIEHSRTVFFWPKMQNNIIAHLSSCCPCAKFKIKQKPEPLFHNVPIVP